MTPLWRQQFAKFLFFYNVVFTTSGPKQWNEEVIAVKNLSAQFSKHGCHGNVKNLGQLFNQIYLRDEWIRGNCSFNAIQTGRKQNYKVCDFKRVKLLQHSRLTDWLTDC